MFVISVIGAVSCCSLTLMYDGYPQFTVVKPTGVERSWGQAEVHSIHVTLWRARWHGAEEAVVPFLAVSLAWQGKVDKTFYVQYLYSFCVKQLISESALWSSSEKCSLEFK